MIKLNHIRAAADRLPERYVFTPCIECDALSEAAAGKVLLKLECLQPVGAYKIRAASHVLNTLDDPGSGVAVSSSGNLARAFAYEGTRRGIPIIAVMMQRTEACKVDAVRSLGAEVVLCDDRHDARWEALAALETRRGVRVIDHFESPEVLAGHGTIGLEVLQQAPESDVVLVPVSSGGLLAGVATAIKEINPKVRVLGVQPELSRAAYESFRAGKPVTVEESRSICDAIVATRPGELPFRHILKYVDDIHLVPDEAVLRAVRLLANAGRLVVEPSGALAAALVLEGKVDLAGKTATLVISGGNVSMPRFAEMLR